MKKRGEFSFVWLFALFVGGAILFFSIYGVMKSSEVSQSQTDSSIAKEISIITDPLQSGFAEGSFGVIKFNQETKIINDCFNDGKFGRNDISVSSRSRVGEEWKVPGNPTRIYNKYIFSSLEDSGEEYYVFVKEFNFPYEVSDIIFLTSRKFCFVNAPEYIEEEIRGLDIENIETENCDTDFEDYESVCFSGASGCDILVTDECVGSNCLESYEKGVVRKTDGRDYYYVDSLLYAAIISDYETYSCNVERLMNRTASLAEIYSKKADLMNARDCGTNVGSGVGVNLNSWKLSVSSANQEDLISLRDGSIELDNINDREVCGLW